MPFVPVFNHSYRNCLIYFDVFIDVWYTSNFFLILWVHCAPFFSPQPPTRETRGTRSCIIVVIYSSYVVLTRSLMNFPLTLRHLHFSRKTQQWAAINFSVLGLAIKEGHGGFCCERSAFQFSFVTIFRRRIIFRPTYRRRILIYNTNSP